MNDIENSITETKNWPDLAAGLYERLTGRRSQITYEFENLDIDVPSKTGEGAEHARWRLNGSVKIRTTNMSSDN